MSRKKDQGVKIASCEVPRQRERVCQHQGPECHSCWQGGRTTVLKKKPLGPVSVLLPSLNRWRQCARAGPARAPSSLRIRAELCLHVQCYQAWG
ncbi:hypothetical protein E2C01_023406 [Portunus trituberculatus]|uniref:Uncharacterized protein n=1 Tax=Portunus trituberculatus TaxID=210409 RepID=A0A5B7E9W6_PORTR|nr:hypothetical protein [Portunus trituberculatus]